MANRKRNYRVVVEGTNHKGEPVRYTMFVYGVASAAEARAEIRSNKFRKDVMRKYHTSLDAACISIDECNARGGVYGQAS